MVLVGLAVLLASCEKDISDRTGLTVPIIFSTTTTGYETEAVRSLGAREPETVVVPMGDNIYMYATLKPDQEEETTFDSNQLRAVVPLENGQKVRFAAFNKTTGVQQGSTVTYTHTGGSLCRTAIR